MTFKDKFEDWAQMQGLRLERQKNMLGGDMGRYEFGPTQAAFEVWDDAWGEALKSVVVKLPDGKREYQSSSHFEDGFAKGYNTSLNDIYDCLDDAGVNYE